MMEILKQDQYSPLPVEEQIAVIFFASHGDYAKDVEVRDMARTGNELLQFLRTFHPEVLAAIREQKVMTDEITADLDKAIKEFKSK